MHSRMAPKLDLIAIRIFDPRKVSVVRIFRGLFDGRAFTLRAGKTADRRTGFPIFRRMEIGERPVCPRFFQKFGNMNRK